MDYNKVKELLNRYFDGKSSLEEEQLLKEYFTYTKEIQEELKPAKALFDQLSKEASEQCDIEPVIPQSKNWISTRFAIRLAASIVLLCGLFYFFQQPTDKPPYAYINGKAVTDQNIAIKETKKALFSITTRLNRGTKDLSKLSKLNKVQLMLTSKKHKK